MRDRDGVVHRHAIPAVAPAVKARVEPIQIGHERAGAASAGQPVDVLLGHESLMGDVEPDHGDVEPAAKDAAGRLQAGTFLDPPRAVGAAVTVEPIQRQ